MTAVSSLAVDRHRRCNDQLAKLRGPLDHFLKQDRGTEIVCLYIPDDLVHRLSDADLGGLVINNVNAIERTRDDFGVANIAPNKFSLLV